jgi:hypothetical protein
VESRPPLSAGGLRWSPDHHYAQGLRAQNVTALTLLPDRIGLLRTVKPIVTF